MDGEGGVANSTGGRLRSPRSTPVVGPSGLLGGIGAELGRGGQRGQLGLGVRYRDGQRQAAVAAVRGHRAQVIGLELGEEVRLPVRAAVDDRALPRR